jgi:hypothetical protein
MILDNFKNQSLLKLKSIQDDFLIISSLFFLMSLTTLFLVRLNLFNSLYIYTQLVVSLFLYLIIKINFLKKISVNGIILFLLLFGSFVLYALFPTYFILGGRDPGLYLIFSVVISKTGGMNLDLPFLEHLHDIYGDSIKLGYSGLFSAFELKLDSSPSKLLPQFMHLFPSIGAIFYKFWGIEGLVRVNAFIGIMALWSFYKICRELLDFRLAIMATAMLAFNPAFIWGARITLTECLSIFILFFGLFLISKSFTVKSSLFAFFGGSILGLALLNRIDSAFNSLLIFGVIIYSLYKKESFKSLALPLTFGYFFSSTIALTDAFFNSYYLHYLKEEGSVYFLLLVNYLPLIIGVILFYFRHSLIVKKIDNHLIDNSFTLIILMSFIWIIFSLFIWSNFESSFNARSLSELAWYQTHLIIFLFPFGMYFSLKQSNNKPIIFPLIICSAITFFVYSAKPSITPDHIWASRRWLQYSIPFSIIFSVYALKILLERIKIKPINLSIVVCFFTIYFLNAYNFSKPYLFQSMLGDIQNGYQNSISKAKNFRGEVWFTYDKYLAPIFTYLYDQPTVLFSQKGFYKAIDGRIKDFTYLGDEFNDSDLQTDVIVKGLYLEELRGKQPKHLYLKQFNSNVKRISDVKNILFRYKNNNLGTEVGKKNYIKGYIESTSKQGFLQYGPYISLDKGKYIATWDIEFLKNEMSVNSTHGFIDVTNDLGVTTLNKKWINNLISGSHFLHLEFDNNSPLENVEFRLYVNNDQKISFRSLSIRKLN